MMQQAQDFLEESQAVYAAVSDLTEPELATPTQFKAWTIADIIRHLHMWNWAATLTLEDADRFRAFLADMNARARSGETPMAFEATWAGDLRGRALVQAWRDGFLATPSGLGGRIPRRASPGLGRT